MKQALILHGWEWTPDNHCFPWLKQELEKKDFRVIIPSLANTNYPVLADHLEDLENISLNKGDIIIGHSLGCSLAINYIEKKEPKNINVILVAPTYPNMTDELWEKVFRDAYEDIFNYTNEELNFRKIDLLNNKYTIFLSDNDKYINEFSAKEFYSQLKNVQYVELHNKGHFDSWECTAEFPEILDHVQ